MLTLRIFAFMALIVGAFRLLDLRFTDLFRDFINKPQSIRTQIDEATNRKKKRFIVRQIEEVPEIMRLTDREDKIPVVFIACAVFAIAGAIIASLFNNVFLIPVLGIGMMCLPIWYVKLTASHFKKDISEELETALFSYLRAHSHTLKREVEYAEMVELFVGVWFMLGRFAYGDGLSKDGKKCHRVRDHGGIRTRE